MNDRTKGVMIGMSGLLSGLCAGLIVALPVWSKAAMVVAVSAVVSTIVWAFLRPGRDAPSQSRHSKM